MIYLASPHHHEDKLIMEIRYLQVMKKTAELLKEGHFVYSPIVHCHAMANIFGLPHGFDWWGAFDEHTISKCDELWVLMIDGWKESKGVRREMELAYFIYRLPIFLVEMDSTIVVKWEGHLD